MLTRLAARTLAGFGVVAGVVTLTFFALRLAPGDPVEHLLGPAARPKQLAAQRHALGLDRSIPVQYTAWVTRFVRGDWGISIAKGRPVRSLLGDAWPATVRLVGLSLLLTYLLGIAIGVVQAHRSGSRTDTALSVITVTLFAVPGFWLGLMLVIVFTYWSRVLPAFGTAGLDADYLTGWGRLVDGLRHLALPLATLTLIGVGGSARFVRGAMLDLGSQQFVTTAHAKGLAPWRVTVRHGLRNALTPLVTNGAPNTQGDIVATRFLAPLSSDVTGAFHFLGTDRFGRDVWTRIVYGARVSLSVGMLSVLISIVLGVAVGALAGYGRRPVRLALLGFTDFALAVPRVVILLLLAALWRPSTALVIVVLGLTGWMSVARLVQGEVRALAARPFVDGAVALGARPLRVLTRHILPNALTPVIVAAALGLCNAITLAASLSFLR